MQISCSQPAGYWEKALGESKTPTKLDGMVNMLFLPVSLTFTDGEKTSEQKKEVKSTMFFLPETPSVQASEIS